jgi:hypothetical protein
MSKLLSKADGKHVDGISRAMAHARRMHSQGLLSDERLGHLKAAALEERLRLGTTEEYVALRESGAWDRIEESLKHEEAGTRAQREDAMRIVARHLIADTWNSTDDFNLDPKPLDEALKNYVKIDPDVTDPHEHLGKALLDSYSGWDDSPEKPDFPPPAWSKPIQSISDDDADARDFKLRMEGTKGSKEWNASHDAAGVKRAADGRIISEKTLRADADRPKPKKSEYDDTRGYTADHEFGVQSASDAAEIQRFESDRANDAAAEAAPAPAVEQGPYTIPSPGEA